MGKGTLNRRNAQAEAQILAGTVNSPRLCAFHWWYVAGWGLWLLHPPPLTHPTLQHAHFLLKFLNQTFSSLLWAFHTDSSSFRSPCCPTSAWLLAPHQESSPALFSLSSTSGGAVLGPSVLCAPSALCDVPEDTDPVLSPYFQHLV